MKKVNNYQHQWIMPFINTVHKSDFLRTENLHLTF